MPRSAYVLILLCATGTSAAVAQGAVGSTAFNPAISLILDGKYTSYSGLAPELTGVLAGGETEGIAEGFSLGESEIAASANVDDKFFGFVTLAAELDEDETALNLEEAWIQTLALPGGLGVKAGKFFSDIGYQNVRHPHTWDFVDAPLPYAAFLGGNYADTGVQLRWLAPTILFIELGGELLRGEAFPAAGASSNGAGASSVFARIGGDLGVDHSWRFGLSLLRTESVARQSMLGTTSVLFDGDTDVGIVDFVWKWARNGNTRDQNFTIVAEYLTRSEQGRLSEGAVSLDYDESHSGYYVYGTYQFRPPRWRVGLRFDAYEADARLAALPGIGPVGADPDRVSAMVDFSNSEFSRLRLQLSDYDPGDGSGSTTAVSLQYIMSLGSHGAHLF